LLYLDLAFPIQGMKDIGTQTLTRIAHPRAEMENLRVSKMMKRNIAVAMGLALASGFANAQTQGTNTVEVDMTLEAYVAAGLLANVTSSLQFPDIVKPLTGSHKVTVGCDGGITYDNNLATPDGNAEDATGNNANELGQNLAGSIGTISISGELR